MRYCLTIHPVRDLTKPEVIRLQPPSDLIDLTVLVDSPASVRFQCHDGRERTDETTWHERWDIAEDYYFTHARPSRRSTWVVTTESAQVHVLRGGTDRER
jgi:hypothetical protein